MTVSIGIDCGTELCKTCLRENGRTLELCSFEDPSSVLTYLERQCSFYPEPAIAFSVPSPAMPPASLRMFTDQQLDKLLQNLNGQAREDITKLLVAMKTMSLYTYSLPAIRYLLSIPPHRKLSSHNMGTPETLCKVATLIYRMREREAVWLEMQFFYIELSKRSSSIVVVEDGRIVNGIVKVATDYSSECLHAAMRFDDETEADNMVEQAYWEDVTRELAGLVAIHHLEDIVVDGTRQDKFTERFGDIYQTYLYPPGGPGTEGYEVALGAAILAEGRHSTGLAAEVVERLCIYRSELAPA